jgi:flagellar biosynthesis/type III secretory pathway protein FliH
MAEYLRTAIVAIHQLPIIPETLWLRIIGRGNVQKQAIDELEALTPDNPFRKAALELLYNLQQNLQVTQNQDEEDRELLMRLAPLYQQDREQAIQEGEQRGIQQGERLVVENLLKVRFTEIDNQLQAIIEPLLALPPEEFTRLLLQLSREELIDRFR